MYHGRGFGIVKNTFGYIAVVFGIIMPLLLYGGKLTHLITKSGDTVSAFIPMMVISLLILVVGILCCVYSDPEDEKYHQVNIANRVLLSIALLLWILVVSNISFKHQDLIDVSLLIGILIYILYLITFMNSRKLDK